ncbi:MAG TPA: efflux transporter outer membrane subunit [Sphingomonadaceae bacterium]|nr:efflux transporter outer membrane subunit [Sphingomonadaceae bacterium]
MLAMALGGCALGPAPGSYSDPEIAFPEEWSEHGSGDASYELASYWQALGDPVLTELVDQAIANNLDIVQAGTRLVQAREGLSQARASLLPSLAATGGASRAVGDGASNDITSNLGLNANWELDLFGRIGSSAQAARFDYESAGYSLADLQRVIAGQVALQVISARSTMLQLEIARSSLAIQEDNLQIAQWRNQAGLVSSLDVEQARSQRAQTAASIPLLESSYAATANAISTLIGEPPGRVRALLAEFQPLPDPPQLGELGAPVDLLRRRPDIRQSEARLYSDAARIGVARAQLFPLLTLSGNLGTNDAGPLNLFDLVTGSIAASVNQLLFDGGQTTSRIRSAEAAADGSFAGWQSTILSALEEAENAIASRRSAEDRIGDIAESLDAATNAALIARSQYQAGLTDFQTLLTTESQLLTARNSMVSAQADRASAFIRLTQALGGGWAIAEWEETLANGNTP